MNKTVYIAGDWEHDVEVVNKIVEWNNSPIHPINFTYAHELKQARDDSLKCSIKASLRTRLELSDKFILIVGTHTKSLTAGKCQWCKSYHSYRHYCAKGKSLDNSSFIEYECKKAIELGLDILVVYNSDIVDRRLCPDILYNRLNVEHIPFIIYKRSTMLGGGNTSFIQYNEEDITNFIRN